MSHSQCNALRVDQHASGCEFDDETYPRKHENKTYPSPSRRPNISCFGNARGIPESSWVGFGVTPKGPFQNERKSRKAATKDRSIGGRPPLRTLQPEDGDPETHACSLGTCPLYYRVPILVSHSLCNARRADPNVPGREFDVQSYP